MIMNNGYNTSESLLSSPLGELYIEPVVRSYSKEHLAPPVVIPTPSECEVDWRPVTINDPERNIAYPNPSMEVKACPNAIAFDPATYCGPPCFIGWQWTDNSFGDIPGEHYADSVTVESKDRFSVNNQIRTFTKRLLSIPDSCPDRPRKGHPCFFDAAPVPPANFSGWRDIPDSTFESFDLIGAFEQDPTGECELDAYYFQGLLYVPPGTSLGTTFMTFGFIHDAIRVAIHGENLSGQGSLFESDADSDMSRTCQSTVVPGSNNALNLAGWSADFRETTADFSTLLNLGANRVTATYLDDDCRNTRSMKGMRIFTHVLDEGKCDSSAAAMTLASPLLILLIIYNIYL